MNAELERCKRKPGGKRKLEEVNKEVGQDKRPKLKKEKAENRLKKEKLGTHKVIKN